MQIYNFTPNCKRFFLLILLMINRLHLKFQLSIFQTCQLRIVYYFWCNRRVSTDCQFRRMRYVPKLWWTKSVDCCPLTVDFLWAFRLSPSGFPLYLCSLSPLPNPVPASEICSRSQIPLPRKLAKDAASIPNASGATVNDSCDTPYKFSTVNFSDVSTTIIVYFHRCCRRVSTNC